MSQAYNDADDDRLALQRSARELAFARRSLADLLTMCGETPHTDLATLISQVGIVMRRVPKPLTGVGDSDHERTESLISRRYAMLRNAYDPVWSEIPYTIRVPVIRAVRVELGMMQAKFDEAFSGTVEQLREELRCLRAEHERPAPLTEEEAQALILFARDIATGYDHEGDAHRYNNGACRVCNAEKLLSTIRARGEIPPEVRKGERNIGREIFAALLERDAPGRTNNEGAERYRMEQAEAKLAALQAEKDALVKRGEGPGAQSLDYVVTDAEVAEVLADTPSDIKSMREDRARRFGGPVPGMQKLEHAIQLLPWKQAAKRYRSMWLDACREVDATAAHNRAYRDKLDSLRMYCPECGKVEEPGTEVCSLCDTVLVTREQAQAIADIDRETRELSPESQERLDAGYRYRSGSRGAVPVSEGHGALLPHPAMVMAAEAARAEQEAHDDRRTFEREVKSNLRRATAQGMRTQLDEIGIPPIDPDSGTRIERDTSTPEKAAFWANAEKTAREVEKWPNHKRAGVNVADQRTEPRSVDWTPRIGERVRTAKRIEYQRAEQTRRPDEPGEIVCELSSHWWRVCHDDGTKAPYHESELHQESWQPFPCVECGKPVTLANGKGRTREFKRGVWMPIPDDFEIPTCGSCGETYMTTEISDRLDPILEQEWLRTQQSTGLDIASPGDAEGTAALVGLDASSHPEKPGNSATVRQLVETGQVAMARHFLKDHPNDPSLDEWRKVLALPKARSETREPGNLAAIRSSKMRRMCAMADIVDKWRADDLSLDSALDEWRKVFTPPMQLPKVGPLVQGPSSCWTSYDQNGQMAAMFGERSPDSWMWSAHRPYDAPARREDEVSACAAFNAMKAVLAMWADTSALVMPEM